MLFQKFNTEECIKRRNKKTAITENTLIKLISKITNINIYKTN